MPVRYDKEAIRQAAAGRWTEILTAVGGIRPDWLDGRHHPCPKCGGRDRFRMIDADAGSVLCNGCFASKNGDGFSALQWINGCNFGQALHLVAQHVGIKPTSARKSIDPSKDLVFREWNESLVGLWCLKKPPIKPEALLACGARLATYHDRYSVVALPIRNGKKTVGWCVYNLTGGKLPKFQGGKVVGQVKVKNTYGSRPGLIGQVDPDATTVWKTEGPTDLLALLSLDMPDGHSAACNAMGAKENP